MPTSPSKLGLMSYNSLHLIFIVGGVSSSTAATLLGSPVVASVVVVVAVVVVVSEASLPSLSQLTPEVRGQSLLGFTIKLPPPTHSHCCCLASCLF